MRGLIADVWQEFGIFAGRLFSAPLSCKSMVARDFSGKRLIPAIAGRWISQVAPNPFRGRAYRTGLYAAAEEDSFGSRST